MDQNSARPATMYERLDSCRIWIKKKLLWKGNLKDSYAYRLFGSTLFRPELWSFKAEQLARGMALGVFVALTPTMGFQMVLVCALIIFIPSNLPIAIAACWITNPVTAPAIYYAEYKIGMWLMGAASLMPGDSFGNSSAISDIYNIAEAMWIGSLATGIVGAVTGYFGTLGLIGLERKLRIGRLRALRQIRILRRSKPNNHIEDQAASIKSTSSPSGSGSNDV